MAPFMTPSCSSINTIVVSISGKPRSRGARNALRPYNESTWNACRRRAAPACVTVLQVGLVCPFAVDHFDHYARTLVETGVIGGRHGKHPLRCRQVFDLLDGVAQGLAELRRAGLGARLQSMGNGRRSEEHTSELQSLMRISYAVFCLKKKIKTNTIR